MGFRVDGGSGSMRRTGGFAMSAAVPLCPDFSADDLRRLARAGRDAGQSRRRLALAVIHDGGRRTEAARVGAVGCGRCATGCRPSTPRDRRGWSTARRRASRPSSATRSAKRSPLRWSKAPTRSGTAWCAGGARTWRRKDLAAWLHTRFRVSLGETTVGREQRRLGSAKMSARPRHHAQARRR